MKKIILSIIVSFAFIISLNAQQLYVKHEYMKVLPGQDYEKLEKSWENYHNEQIKAGIVNLHRVWKVLPGNNVDYDYIVTTVFKNYADALGIGKSISVNDFKAKYPEDYKVMQNSTSATRTIVRDIIFELELGINDTTTDVVPGKTVVNMVFVKSKNDKYDAAEMKFSKKWHQYAIDSKRKGAFYLSKVVGSDGIDVDFSHLISHQYKNIDQLVADSKPNTYKLTLQDQANLNQLITYRELKKSILLLNVLNLD